jgi:chaperone protein EcpD
MRVRFKNLFGGLGLAGLMGLLTMTGLSSALAAVTIMGTRVVYNATDRDVTVQLSNSGAAPALVQAWVDLGDPKAAPESIDAPFVLSPPMFRIDPNHKQNLRMVFTGRDLPKDRESVFWLNVLEIPPKPGEVAGENYLQFSVRSRIKIFYRPTKLPGDANSAAKLVQWKYHREGGGSIRVTATNPTPYHVSFSEIVLSTLPIASGTDDLVKAATAAIGKPVSGMVPPLSSAEFVVQGVPTTASAPASLVYSSVNDWGGFVSEGADLVAQP